MPRLLLICLLLCLPLTHAIGQDTTIVLLNKTFISKEGKPLDFTNLSHKGWVYKPGHSPTWARAELNTSDWTKRAPDSFSAQDADATGRAEGWFRRRIRFDSTFNVLPLGLRSYGWAASEVYINGKLVAVFGSIGRGDTPYADYNSNLKPPLPVQLEAGKVYLIAIHIVDYLFPFPPFAPKKLKSEVFKDIDGVLLLAKPQQVTDRLIEGAKLYSGFCTLWFTVSLLLALLFWSLSTQELPEKNIIQLWAIVETFFAISTLFRYAPLIDSSFTDYYVRRKLIDLFEWQNISLALIAYLRVFGYRIPNKWIGVGVVVSLVGSVVFIYSEAGAFLFYGCCLCELVVVIFVTIASKKRLKGALWAVVVGCGFTALFATLLGIIVLTKTQLFNNNPFISYLLISGAFLSLPLSFLVYLTLRFKETLAEVRTNAAAVVQITEEKRDLLASQNERLEQQVEARTAELKASQQQLIQKEKMASLGELTAGIAHEIQNPLNFVNNFSEVSAELVTELEEEQHKPNRDTDLEADLLGDLKQNLQKITLHGGRASAIVKGMLEHSRSSTGEKRPTNLNALADEYLKIAYHGLRAKDKDFNAELVTDFGSDLGLTELAPQEIGRVLLNLYNNAFYAVNEKQKLAPSDYKPTVTISTTQLNGHTQIRVSDNGTGIPESVKAKIFQPFFTTKPTGEGTGLGLSLSYDIVTKGHGGTLTVECQEGEGTTFITQLPKTN